MNSNRLPAYQKSVEIFEKALSALNIELRIYRIPYGASEMKNYYLNQGDCERKRNR